MKPVDRSISTLQQGVQPVRQGSWVCWESQAHHLDGFRVELIKDEYGRGLKPFLQEHNILPTTTPSHKKVHQGDAECMMMVVGDSDE